MRNLISVSLFVSLAYLLVMTSAGTPFTFCDDARDFNITNITVTPWPPIKGTPVGIEVDGILDEQVTSGVVQLVVILNGSKFYSQPNNWGAGSTLPAGPGELTYSYSITIPKIAPKGNYEVQLTFDDQDSYDLTCISIAFPLP